jgi:cobalt-zinc-cadmium efflux system membrane fusion protein
LQGSRVKKGQRIATIENLDFIQIQQDYLEAKSQFDFASADYQRQQELAKENVNSQKVLQQSKSNYQTWQAKYNGLKEKLNVLNINVPTVEKGDLGSTINLFSKIDGYVTEVNVNIGKFVNPTDVLFEIVDTEHLHAELIIFEKDVPKLKIGQKVRFTLANETKERLATVYLIGREISEDRTIRIHCHIDEEDKELLPGMYLMAVVETGGALVPAIPNEAVIDYQGKKYMFVVLEEAGHADANHDQKPKNETNEEKADGGMQFKMQEIETGNSELGYTQITLPETLEDDTEVVVKGAYSLLSKLKNSEEEGGHAH